MSRSSCPSCQSQTVQWLVETSQTAQLDYYRCVECGRVWHMPKDESDFRIVSVRSPNRKQS